MKTIYFAFRLALASFGISLFITSLISLINALLIDLNSVEGDFWSRYASEFSILTIQFASIFILAFLILFMASRLTRKS